MERLAVIPVIFGMRLFGADPESSRLAVLLDSGFVRKTRAPE
jgi:hypothetical protein